MIKLFHGKTPFLSRTSALAAVDTVKKRCEEKNIPYELHSYDTSSTPADEIIAEIETPSLFGEHKILFLKRTSKNTEKEALFETISSLLGRKDVTTPDIILWEDAKMRANLTILRPFKENNAIEESPELNKRTFRTWAQDQLKGRKIRLTRDAMYLLSERVNYDPERLIQELAKISLINKETIDETDIENLCPDTLENTIWELIDAINDNDGKSAERKLDRLLRQGNDPNYVLVMIGRNLRIMLLVKNLLENGASTGEIARKIRVPPFTVSAMKNTARTTSYQRIATLYEKITSIDYSGKTGQLDIALALNILLSVI